MCNAVDVVWKLYEQSKVVVALRFLGDELVRVDVKFMRKQR